MLRFAPVSVLTKGQRTALDLDEDKEQLYAYMNGGWPQPETGYDVNEIREAFEDSRNDLERCLADPERVKKEGGDPVAQKKTMECFKRVAEDTMRLLLEMETEGYVERKE